MSCFVLIYVFGLNLTLWNEQVGDTLWMLHISNVLLALLHNVCVMFRFAYKVFFFGGSFMNCILIWPMTRRIKSTEIVAHYLFLSLLKYHFLFCEISCVRHNGCVNSWRMTYGCFPPRSWICCYGPISAGIQKCHKNQAVEMHHHTTQTHTTGLLLSFFAWLLIH